jgi:regulation of enolase protein 1 (concanavalin A-like superfamily)
MANPVAVMVDSSKSITATFTEKPPTLLNEDFNSYSAGDNPAGWQDTAANNSMAVDDSLFAVSDVNGERVFGTSSTASNIHSHHQSAGSAGFNNYVYTGRMMLTNGNGGIGVTFLSDYNQTDTYYRLRRFGSGGSFQLSPHGTNISGGTTDSGVVPAANTWYQFKIEMEDADVQTNMQAKIWQEGTAEPAEWQIDAYDSSAGRLTAGTVGVWSHSFGSKYWDDLVVVQITPPGPHALTLNSSGSGVINADPDLAEYADGTSVQLTAVPDAGWAFLEWSGDLSGGSNPATVVMNGDKSVTAVFVEDIPQTVTTNVDGSGAITLDPDQAEYSVGDEVTVTAVPDAGWHFAGWSGDLNGMANPALLAIDSSKSITATFTEEPPTLLSEDFNSYSAGDNPAGWQDTAANNSMAVDDSLFAVSDVNGELALGTSSTASNIHSHYQGVGSADFSNYVYTGRMRLTANDGGIGVTFLSDYNQTDSYYRLRRFGSGGSFRLSPHGASISGGVSDSGVVPAANTWYLFRIEVEDAGLQTNIRAKVWAEGSAEPAEWQIDAYDSSAGRLTAGTVGVWSHGSGSKYWDDLSVAYLEPGPFTLTLNSSGSGAVTADPAQTEYGRNDVVTVTAAPAAGWQFDSWSGDLSGSNNPTTITMSGDRTVTALFTPVPTYTVTTSVSGNGTITIDPDQANYEENAAVTVAAIPDAGWRFTGWSGDLSGTTNPATFVVDRNKNITATFIEDLPLSLSANTVGNGTATTTPDQTTYSYGEAVTITATADSGWRFESWQSDPPIATGWWNAEWNYRLPITVDGAGYTRVDAPVEVELDLTSALAGLGVTGEIDLNSLRVIEVDGDNNLLNTAVPFQFDPADTFDAAANAAGTLVVLLTGNTGPNAERFFHVYFDLTGKSFVPAAVTPLVTLTDNVVDEGLTTFRIENNNATYYYDKQGGGFSSIVDLNGNDWIGYNSTYGSGGTFRGMPNLVYPEGYMHPGNTDVVSVVERQGPLKSTVRSTTLDGQWETIWEFYPDFTRLTVVQTGHNYWFLYEGTPGGTLDVNDDIVARSDGTQTLAGESWSGDLVGEEWVYFGDPVVGRSLFVVNHQQDTAVDSYYAMEGKMTVFGFGRSGTSSYLDTVPATFTVGLVDDIAYETVAGEIQAAYQPFNVILGGAEAQDNLGAAVGETLAFNITANQVVTATFTQLISPTLTATTLGNGSVMIDPDLPQYSYGQTVTVTAVPDTGHYFSGWSGDQVSGSNPFAFTITDDTVITANFAEDVPLTLAVSTTGNGTVQLTPDQPTYSYGQVVTVTAVADTDWLFDSWGGDLSGDANPTTIVMDGDKALSAAFVLANTDLPVIDVWYGDQQRYGHVGLPQPWFNILGNVSDPDGVSSLSYTLNGGAARALSIGSDDRRLANPGDFNVDLHYQDLLVGSNQVTIIAADSLGNQSQKTVSVIYENGNVWPATYTIDWSSVTSLEDVAQVVDGKWEVQPNGLRILEPDYDRLVAIGDVAWTDYEVTVPITIHGVDDEGFRSGASGGAGLGMLLRWNGHTDFPIVNWQPKTGWLPYGAIGWYWWTDINTARLRIDGNNSTILDQSASTTPPAIGGEYIFKMRVETAPGVGGFYQLKVWPSNQPEPAAWDLSGQEELTDPQSGSILLLAHHIDATFGDVTITPLGFVSGTLDVSTSGSGVVVVDPQKEEYSYGETVSVTAVPDAGWVFTGWQGDLSGYDNPTTINMTGSKQITATFVSETAPPTISNVQVTPYTESAIVTWITDKPASSEVVYGETSAYTSGSVSDSTLRTSHTITLTGLISNTTYHYQITSVDANGNAASTPDATFTTTDGSDPSGIASDDFNACTLDSGLWTFLNPVGDGSFALNGTQLLLSVPAGVAHDVWNGGNYAPRLMQPANNTDFELEVKFESLVSAQYQMQGIIVEQDLNNYLRFDFYGNNGQVYLFAARITGGMATSIANVAINAPDQPLFLRVTRVGDSWTQSYSLNGATWTTGASFTHALTVSQVGLFAGNAGSNPPAHTAVVDYFFNTATPIVPEDGNGSSLTVNVVGGGSVSRNPEKTLYVCGESVELTAVADPGWVFDGWSGDLSGADNPAAVTMDSSKVVTATFVESSTDTTPPVISSVQVTPGDETAVVTWNTDEPASSAVAHGQTSSYELGSVSDSALRTSHAITLTGLISNTTYHYQITSVDANGNAASTPDATFTTSDGNNPSGIASDDFNACTLDSGLWTFLNPVGDGSFALNGTQLLLSVPAGVAHDVWNGGNYAPRLMQPANNTDFELEVKFESLVSAQYQMQGIIVEQDPNNYLRFDFYGNNGQVYLFAARITGGMATSIANVAINAPDQPLFLRVTRVGDSWTQSFSLNGATWTTGASFTHALTVSQVGLFAGNAGSNPPAHTAVVDYFFNTATPIVPEDGNGSSLTVNVVGGGSVSRNPEKTLYVCGESVELTAVADPGWVFDGWSGDLSGADNPAAVTMDSSKVVTATFVESSTDTTPPVISSVQVTPGSETAVVTWNTDEPASSAVAHGQTSSYELGSVSDSALRTSHAITLMGLISNTTYHYQITSVDASGNAASTPDATFTTSDGNNPSGIASDDFNACTLDSGLWTFLNPVGDGSFALNGTQLLLSVPAGVAHDVWNGGNYAPRLMQPANNTDFELEVKFESLVSAQYEMQGIIVEQDPNNYLRFDFYGKNGQVYAFAARITGGTATSIANVAINAPDQPLYLRVARAGDSWTQSYSLDGMTWTTSASFTHALTVSEVGVFAGNAGSNPPAHTAVVDYFFNTATPIVPEDADTALTCN